MKNLLLGFWLLFTFGICMAQIDSNSKLIIDSVLIYRDIKILNKFYYAPNKIELVKSNIDGKPDFQFLKMRYVGTQCYGDENERHETNIVQFQVKMNAISVEKLNSLQKKLKDYHRNPKLVPFPISHIKSELIVTVGNHNGNQKIAESNESEQIDNDISNSSKSYWTNRFFTFSLGNQEATLLEDMIKNESLSLSFSYSFFADTTDPLSSISLTGSTEIIERIEKNTDSIPQQIVNRLIYSDTFPLEINVKLWPDIIKQIDINESIPPSYAALTIKNFDFTENLRPELYIKKVEITAVSVDNKNEVTIETKFSKNNPDINSRRIFFPYAVLINKPMKYRITEINSEGNIQTFPWISFNNCNQVLDITSSPEQIKMELNNIEIEVDKKWNEIENSKLVVVVKYLLNNELKSSYIELKRDKIESHQFYSDKDTPIFYEIISFLNDHPNFKSEEKILIDDYIYIN